MGRWFLILLFFTNIAVATESSNYVYNLNKNQVIKENNSTTQKPIASISKLMTALIVVESNPDWQEKISYRGNVFYSRKVSKKELFDSLLIRSDNNAAEAFANAWPGGRKIFLERMNTRAQELKMPLTHFDDPSGLARGNVSTATELAKLIIEVSKHPVIKSTSSSKYISIEHKIGKKIRSVDIGNTNKQLLFEFDTIVLSKTGFTNPAGRCLALLVDKEGSRYAIVILGEKTPKDRLEKARQLINNYVTIQEADKGTPEDTFFLHIFN